MIRGGLCWWARRVWRTVRFESYFKIINNHYGRVCISGHGFFDDVLSDIHEEVVLSLAYSVGRREICEFFPSRVCLEVLKDFDKEEEKECEEKDCGLENDSDEVLCVSVFWHVAMLLCG